jgi:cysteine desulfurase family protein (TIGR01976 family)
MADLLALDPGGIVFGRSATELTFHLARTISRDWSEGDEVVVSRLDHDANVRPWVIAAEASGATVRWAEFDPATGELAPDAVEAVVTERTRLVAVTAASNLIGTRPDLPAIATVAHEAGALLYVDGVHATAHVLTDVPASGADFWVCSPYKFLGPHLGVLGSRPDLLETLHPAKLVPSTDAVPERFELGTLPYELLAGTTSAVDFLADLVPGTGSRRERLVRSFEALEEHEDGLLATLEPRLRAIPALTAYSNAKRRTPTLLVTVAGHDLQALSRSLAARGVNAPAGSFYAWECSHHLGLGAAGGLRAGLAPYTNADDVERLARCLEDICGNGSEAGR